MALELPSYKWPSIRTALLTSIDRGKFFLKKAGTVILAISVVLWWLGAYPHSKQPQQSIDLQAQAVAIGSADPAAAEVLTAEAERIANQHQS